MTAPPDEALRLQRPMPDGSLQIRPAASRKIRPARRRKRHDRIIETKREARKLS
jgi:hypothetical protein